MRKKSGKTIPSAPRQALPPTPFDTDHFARAMLDQLPASIAVVNQDGVIVAVNQPWRDFAAANGPVRGLIGEQARYLDVCDAASGDDRPAALAFAQALRDVLAGRRDHYELEYPCHSPDQQRWFIGHIRPLPTNGPLHAIVFHQDITERKRAEVVLRRSEERFRTVFRNAASGIALVALDGRWLSVNPRICEITGFTEEELNKLTFQDITHPDDLDKDLEYVNQMLAGEIETYTMGKRYIRKDRSAVWINLTVALARDAMGAPDYFISIVDDITAHKRSEQKFRQLYKTMRDAFVVTDMAGSIQEFNPAYQQMLGYSEAELRTLSYRDVTPERWHEFETQIVRDQLLPQGFTDVYEKEYRRKDGTVFPVELRTCLIRDDAGQPVAMWAIVRDLTERKLAEEKAAGQQAAIAHLSRVVTMGELAAGLAHEINQPLGASLLYAETCRDLLKTGVMEPVEMSTVLHRLIEQLKRARATVTHLRTFLRQQPLAYLTVDVNQMLRDSVELLVYTLKQAGVSLVWELASQPPMIQADPVLLQQVVINLVMNALDAMAAPGDRPRRLSLGTVVAAGDCTVGIGDTGPGVPPALTGRIFDSFVTSKPQGMGLGLAISRSIIEQHQGRIWHEPAAEGGALFKFTLPAKASGKKGVPS